MPTPTSGFVYITGIGVVGYPGGVATLYDGCDYDDGDVVIRKGVVTAFDPADFGISDHDDLGLLTWDISGHIGTADKLAGFNSAGEASYYTIGPGLTVSGSTLQSASPWKAIARVATTAAGTLATSFDNGSTVDGITLVTGDRILVKDQSSAADNGLYTVNASGAPTRATDASTAALSQGLAVWITEGSANSGSTWVIDSDPVSSGTYRFKSIVHVSASSIGILAQTAANTFVSRTLTVGTGLAITNPAGTAGNPEIVLDTAIRVCGRLTLESGVSFSTSNQTGKTTVYWVPYNGDLVPIYDGTRFVNRTSTGCDVAVPSAIFRLYDIFAYWTGSVVDLETTDWNQSTAPISAFNAGTQTLTTSAAHGLSVGDVIGIEGITGTVGTDASYGLNGRPWVVATVPSSTTFTMYGTNIGSLAYTSGGTVYKFSNTRATALTRLNGILVKDGDNTRTYLGTGMTTGVSGQTEMSFGDSARLLLWNAQNQLETVANTYDSNGYTYTTGAWRIWNNNLALRVWFVLGESQSVDAWINAAVWGGAGFVGFAYDSFFGTTPTLVNNNTGYMSSVVSKKLTLSAGAHVSGVVEYGASGFYTGQASFSMFISM